MTDHHVHPEPGDRLILHVPHTVRRRGRRHTWPFTLILFPTYGYRWLRATDADHNAFEAALEHGEQLTLEEAS